MNTVGITKDEYGVKIKYPNRKCEDCSRYPCFSGIEKCVSNFAKYGCTMWSFNKKKI